jgi:DNA-binding beta-propeller fold protein YncE
MKTKTIAVALATIAATISLAACSTSTNDAGPTTTSSSAPATSQASSCEVNPSSAPVPAVERFKVAPADSRVSVTMTGIPSGTVKPGDPLTEVDVTLCNDSPVDYSKIGVVFVLTRCSCSASPIGLPQGTAERFDAATESWIKLDHPVIGTGMDYIGGYTDVQPLPRGKEVTLKYRVALDASMADGKGGVEATVVMPDELVQIGKADLPFSVSKEPSTAPAPRQAVLPFTDLTHPSGVAVDAAGDVYLADSSNHRVLKLAAGSKDQTVLPFTGLQTPTGVAVDSEGNVYVTDGPNNRVVKLAAGSNDQTVLPFTDIHYPGGLAVDTAGNVYVTSYSDGESTVVRLAAGSNELSVLPLTGLKSASAVAVDGAGSLYVNDGPNNRVVTLACTSPTFIKSG